MDSFPPKAFIELESMRILTFVIIMLFSLINCALFGQSVQDGIVLEYNGKNAKTPLANVEIVVNNAGSTVSDANGKFTLNFRTLKPGDKITIRRIEKIGYEIFNTETVEQLVITRSNEPITIVMCKTETLRNIRNQYTKIAQKSYNESLAREERVLKAQVRNGQMTKEQYEKKVKELQDQYEEQLENIENYIERFSHIDLSEINDIENRVVNLVNQGKIEDAISQFDTKTLIDSYRAESRDYHVLSAAEAKIAEAAERKKQAIDSIKVAIHRQIDLLMLTGGQDNFDKILSLLRDVAQIDTTDFDALMEYANMAFDLHKTDEAMEYYNKSINAANNDVVKTALANIKKGYAYSFLNQYDEAMWMSQIALHDLDSLVQSTGDQDLYLEERCFAQRTIASLFQTLNDYNESIRYYSYSEQGYRVLFHRDSTTYTRSYADVNLLYARVLDLNKETEEAEMRMKESIRLYTKLYNKSPERNSAILACAHCWLGELYRNQRKFKESEEHLKKSIELYESACKFNPSSYTGFIAESWVNMGKLHLWTEEFDKAETELFKAYEIYNTLQESSPEAYKPSLAKLYYNIGSLYFFQKDYEKAAKYDSLSVKEYEVLYQKSKLAYYIELGTSYGYLGNCYFEMQMYLEAEEYYEKMLEVNPTSGYRDRLEQTRTIIKRKKLRKP